MEDCEFEQQDHHTWYCTVHRIVKIAGTTEPVSCGVVEGDKVSPETEAIINTYYWLSCDFCSAVIYTIDPPEEAECLNLVEDECCDSDSFTKLGAITELHDIQPPLVRNGQALDVDVYVCEECNGFSVEDDDASMHRPGCGLLEVLVESGALVPASAVVCHWCDEAVFAVDASCAYSPTGKHSVKVAVK